ncbi:MAG: DUF2975 domain-containing protein [Clostridia bacterium]|nr:DUF2975 domain-containing protein [Clostridia bacterium]
MKKLSPGVLKNQILPYVANAMLGVIFLAGIAVYATLPWIVNFYMSNSYAQIELRYYNTILSMLYCVGLPVLALLMLAFLLTLNITKGRSFVRQNALYLNLISVCSLVAALVFFVFMFFMYSIFPIVLFTIFVLLAILTKVFADLFKTAIKYKEENELTI